MRADRLWLNISTPQIGFGHEAPDNGDEWIRYDEAMRIVQEHNAQVARKEQSQEGRIPSPQIRDLIDGSRIELLP